MINGLASGINLVRNTPYLTDKHKSLSNRNLREGAAMDEQLNYFGATVFWLYILAALSFSTIVIYTIFTIPQTKISHQARRDNDVAIFSALACISFATLSFNMLNVLIQSFNSWIRDNGVGANTSVLEVVWKWSITSTLFQDFAEAIVASSSRYLWSQAALFGTLSVCLHMAAEGTIAS